MLLAADHGYVRLLATYEVSADTTLRDSDQQYEAERQTLLLRL